MPAHGPPACANALTHRHCAEGMLVYRPKPHACAFHLRQHARQYSATELLEGREAWISSFSAEAKIARLERHDDHWHYVVFHPDIEHMAIGALHLPVPEAKAPKDTEVFGAVFDQYAANLVSDIGAARAMRSPLGAAASIHEALLSTSPAGPPRIQDALFNLSLPVISDLKTQDLIKLRQENWQYFDAFRSALKAAARELISNAKDGIPPAGVARQIETDVIEPELIRIRQVLRASVDSLTHKSAISLPVGAVATTIGLLDKFPMMVAGTAAVLATGGIGSFLVDYKKYIDDRREVRLSDMYFLWKVQHAIRSGSAQILSPLTTYAGLHSR